MSNQKFKIEIFFPVNKKLKSREFLVSPGTTLDYFLKSHDVNILCDFRDVKYGVFGKIVNPDYIIKQGDRIEIYHQASKDPKKARIKRAESKKKA